MMAIAQNDGKKVLAFSTISNLGLIVGCAGIGAEETVWAAVFLMIFHSVSKSMLFQSVGATENTLGSRDIEDMHGLIIRVPKLAYIMGIGIAGMYLAPFGMLISKWVALKAFVDSGNFVLVLCIGLRKRFDNVLLDKMAGQAAVLSYSERDSERCDAQR